MQMQCLERITFSDKPEEEEEMEELWGDHELMRPDANAESDVDWMLSLM